MHQYDFITVLLCATSGTLQWPQTRAVRARVRLNDKGTACETVLLGIHWHGHHPSMVLAPGILVCKLHRVSWLASG